MITLANEKKILVFASPSNWGNRKGYAFPGKLSREFQVITMFATLPNCNPDVQKVNPPPFDIGFSFAILGVDVKLLDLDGTHDGTSISTVIGAAFAARLLDFSKHPDCRQILGDRASRLRTVAGMSAVFNLTANLVAKYHCMRPWVLIPEQNTDKNNCRKKICKDIYDALEYSKYPYGHY
jgi:hypothetical protein